MIHHGILTFSQETKKLNVHWSSDNIFFRTGEYNHTNILYWLKYFELDDLDGTCNKSLYICDDEGREQEMIWKSFVSGPDSEKDNWILNESFSYSKNYLIINPYFVDEFLKFAQASRNCNTSTNFNFVNFAQFNEFISVNKIKEFSDIKMLFPTRESDLENFWIIMNDNVAVIPPNSEILRNFVTTKSLGDLIHGFNALKDLSVFTNYLWNLANLYITQPVKEKLYYENTNKLLNKSQIISTDNLTIKQIIDAL
jgi:hypothetical protein